MKKTNTARNLVEWIRSSINSLAVNPDYGSLNSVYRELVEKTGLSRSIIIKLVSGESQNPTADTMDKLITAIKQIHMRMAA